MFAGIVFQLTSVSRNTSTVNAGSSLTAQDPEQEVLGDPRSEVNPRASVGCRAHNITRQHKTERNLQLNKMGNNVSIKKVNANGDSDDEFVDIDQLMRDVEKREGNFFDHPLLDSSVSIVVDGKSVDGNTPAEFINTLSSKEKMLLQVYQDQARTIENKHSPQRSTSQNARCA
ncbi:expressed unknown protein [Seminavis robusta]|uniref:Uncharacterized protein n=1 Tax=Seminavis robusta TaxID=568900 RepID=A0A9N8H3Y4_9STRA|nr:expressed unknown protein [Seminavis robusta]|eukprot:Sro72_g039740.1 n/a (173) ;mRNA; f:28068-28746